MDFLELNNVDNDIQFLKDFGCLTSNPKLESTVRNIFMNYYGNHNDINICGEVAAKTTDIGWIEYYSELVRQDLCIIGLYSNREYILLTDSNGNIYIGCDEYFEKIGNDIKSILNDEHTC